MNSRKLGKAEALLLDAITESYVRSNDFNGAPVREFVDPPRVPWEAVRGWLANLVKAKKTSLCFASRFPNPHIKAFDELPVDEQLKRLASEPPGGICAYPSPSVLRRRVKGQRFQNRPFTLRLAMGEPQMARNYFELPVLEPYLNDPRYRVWFGDYDGGISVSDKHYRTRSTPRRDEVLLQTFGLGYDRKGRHVVVVYLRYLADLSPKHQQIWRAHSLSAKGSKMSEAYYRNTVLGEFVEGGSIYEAFIEEQAVINAMANRMGRPGLFRRTFKEQERPAGFHVLLRPTLGRFQGFMHLLDKMLSDNIDKDFFAGEVPLQEETTRKDGKVQVIDRGTIALLNDWLRLKFRVKEPEVFDQIITPLKEVRKLRQPQAHAILEDEHDEKYLARQQEIMRRACGALRLMRLLFTNHPKAKAVEVPEWLYKGIIYEF